MGTRFDVEISRFFHPATYQPRWREESLGLNRNLTRDSVAGLRAIVGFVEANRKLGDESLFVEHLSAELRAKEKVVRNGATSLEEEIRETVGADCRHTRPAPWPNFTASEPRSAQTV